jgi:DNA-binding HxlR family transcriptional regulator
VRSLRDILAAWEVRTFLCHNNQKETGDWVAMRRIGVKTVGECPCEVALRFIGGAWKVLIVWHLAHHGKHRHAELKRRLSGITTKILTQQLREMEQDGLLQRHVYPEVPPRVEYQLTALGETLRPILDAMYAWGKEHGNPTRSRGKVPLALNQETGR